MNTDHNKLNNIPEFNTQITMPSYGKAVLAGIGTSIVVAGLLAFITILLEAEYVIVLCIAASLVAFPIQSFVPKNSFRGAMIGGILCPLTYFAYRIIFSIAGYYFESEGEYTLLMTLIVSCAFGSYLGYNKED